ncbi:restriction endonuclease subunit S [Vibrio parahaemolyticus]|nr:restriction endonuclease subunit S [Vibrio parahaemolyticus]
MSELVPEGWTFQPIGDYVEKMVGGAPLKPSDFSTDGHRVIPKKAVQFGGKIKFDVETYCSSDFAENNIKNVVDSQYLITTLRDLVPSGPTIGVIGVLEEKGPFVLAQGVYGLKTNNISDEYLAQVSNTSWYRNEMRKVFVGSTQVHIRNQEFLDVKVPFPPLPEQKKIAAILTSVDAVIEKTQAQIDKLKDLKTGMMQELLTRGVGVDGKPHTEFKDSPVGRIPKSWEVVNVGSLVDVIDPQPDHRTPPEVENGIPYVGLGDIDKSGVINFSGARKVSQAAFDKQCKSFELHKGAFVFGKIGTIGNPSILPEQRFYCLSANVVLITGVNYEVLRYIFQVFTSGIINEQIAQQTNTTSQPALGIKKVRDFLVPLPTHSEMKSLVGALSSIDQRLAVVKTKLDKLKSSKKALMQDLLTGKVRVKVED